MARLRITHQRSSLVAMNVLASFAIQGAALVLALFTLPAYIRFFDDQVALGAWFTILSVLSWILNLDLGVGNGLRNRLVTTLVDPDRTTARKYISSSYVLGLTIVIGLSAMVALAFPVIDWNRVLAVPTDVVSRGGLTQSVIITTVGILIQFFLRLIVSILYALQRSAVTGTLNLASSAGMLLVVTTMSSDTNADKLVLLSIASVVCINTPLAVATVIVFRTSLKGSSPSLRFFDRDYAWDVTRVGGKFFLLQFMFMLIANTDPFLISHFAGPQYVVDYQIYSRFFFLFSSMLILALTPIWSAVTQAYALGDLDWIEHLYKRLKYMALGALVGLIALCGSLQWLVDLWLRGDSIEVDPRYALVFAALAMAMIWTGILASIANGIGRLRVQLTSYTIGVIIKIPLALILTQAVGSWIAVIVASAIALLPYSLAEPLRIRGYLTARRVGTSAPA